ncbi:MAG: hypothetical protein K5739_04860 [Lachnospiraceae bacterium]|nr:hypothetical protein [Lachnospiraceae bacterium]
MLKKIQEIRKTLNTTIFTGKRLKDNLTALTYVSLFTALLGLILLIIDIATGQMNMIFPAAATFLGGSVCAYCAAILKKREIAIQIPLLFCAVMFTFYTIKGVGEGTAVLWSLLLPIGICYFVSVKYGIILSVYYLVFFSVMFYTPLKEYISVYYPRAFMIRFPLLYGSMAAFTAIAMIQYHRSVLLEENYSAHLALEVEKQTKVAKSRAEKLDKLNDEMVMTLAVAIPVHARIVAIADAFDAMHSDRIYRSGLPHDVIRKELVEGRGRQFDPEMLDAFLELFDDGILEQIAKRRKIRSFGKGE